MIEYKDKIRQKIDSLDLERKWELLLDKLATLVGKRPENLDTVLFLIGVQELGQGVKVFTKEQKQDLMHIAICRILSKIGMYELVGQDQDGWPHWQATGNLPALSLGEQEDLLKMHALEYFEDEDIF
ncbi:MAG: hypothetical protein MUE85_24150 [Microscillaceae bacterium]|jgi:hypothetical protein|nr:hypothetical protein [Microscillaceae bacterium]